MLRKLNTQSAKTDVQNKDDTALTVYSFQMALTVPFFLFFNLSSAYLSIAS